MHTGSRRFVKLTKTELDEFVLQHRPLVYKFAIRLHKRYPKVPQEDFESWGWISLYEVIERFEPERGFTFLTYAYHTLPWRMKRAINEHDWLKRHDRNRYGNKLASVGLFSPEMLQEMVVSDDKQDRELVYKDLIEKALKGLPVRRKKIWWLWVDTGNYAEVGRQMNLTRQRVEQIINPIMRDIKRLAGN